MSEEIKYNIAGQGMLSANLYDYAQNLYVILSNVNHDVKFHNTKQLGAITDLLKGAHHTRYEYLFIQWALIKQLEGISSGNATKVLGKLSNQQGYISGKDLLQCLSILVNLGHFPSTFADSRVWVHILAKNEKKIRSGMKSGLSTVEEKELLDKYTKEFDSYNIHLVNALFLLDRYKNFTKNEDIDLYKRILTEYILKNNEALIRYWDIYNLIRKISYIVLDSNYAPIPFNLDLSSIILNINNYNNSIQGMSNSFNNTLDQINNVLEASVYLDKNSIIVSSIKSNKLYDAYSKIDEVFDKVSSVRKVLEPINKSQSYINNIFQGQNNLFLSYKDWYDDDVLDLTYNNIEKSLEVFPKDAFEFEQTLVKKIGSRTSYVGASYPPIRNKFRLVLVNKKSISPNKKTKKILDALYEVMKFNCDLLEKDYSVESDINKEILTSLLRNIFFEHQNKYEYEFFINNMDLPILYSRGASTLLRKVYRFINEVKGSLTNDQLLELRKTAEVLSSLKYQGPILVHLGSTKIKDKISNQVKAEFDGLIFIPKKDKFLYIIESKNKSKGHTEASRQLNKRLDGKLSPGICYDIQLLKRGAYASIALSK